MTFIYPDLSVPGWHLEASWHWDWFALGFTVAPIGADRSYVLNLGFLHFLVWCYGD